MTPTITMAAKVAALARVSASRKTPPEEAWKYLEGIVDADVWATFEIPYKHLRISIGVYADHSEGAGFGDIVTKTEWCCTSYDKTIAKVVDYCCPFQGEEYRELKKFANEFLNNITK